MATVSRLRFSHFLKSDMNRQLSCMGVAVLSLSLFASCGHLTQKQASQSFAEEERARANRWENVPRVEDALAKGMAHLRNTRIDIDHEFSLDAIRCENHWRFRIIFHPAIPDMELIINVFDDGNVTTAGIGFMPHLIPIPN